MNWFLLATGSALFSATAAVVQKKVLFKLHALEFSFCLSLVILVFSLFVPFSADVTSLSPTALLILIGKSILGGLAFLLVMMSLEHNQISSALPLLGTTPAVTAILALPMLGEALHSTEWIGIGMMVIGTYMLEKKSAQPMLQPWKNILSSKNYRYILGAVLLFALSSVADKLLLSGYKTDPLIVLFYQHIIYCLIFGTLMIIRKYPIQETFRKSRSQLPFIGLIALLTLAYRFTQLGATQLAPVALVLAVKRTSILYASFFGGKLFSEERLAKKLIGALCIVAAGFLILRNVA